LNEATSSNIQSSIFNIHWSGDPAQKRAGFTDRSQTYLRALLEAFSGLILALAEVDVELTWEARLQLPFFHFTDGSGHAVQYQPDENSDPRLQPSHCSTT
jgi:hypothetical protein